MPFTICESRSSHIVHENLHHLSENRDFNVVDDVSMEIESSKTAMSLCPIHNLIEVPARMNRVHPDSGSVILIAPLPDDEAARSVRDVKRRLKSVLPNVSSTNQTLTNIFYAVTEVVGPILGWNSCNFSCNRVPVVIWV